MSYEKDTLETIILARSAVGSTQNNSDIKALDTAETQLRLGLGNLFALAESYPELKANESFQHLQALITALEHDIADRREFYNDSTNLNNIRIEQFPDVLMQNYLTSNHSIYWNSLKPTKQMSIWVHYFNERCK